MIEVVTEADLERLGGILPEMPRARQHAFGILMEIIERLPRPRAYISEPTHMPDDTDLSLWNVTCDMLSAQLNADGMSIIEADTVRYLSLYCTVLENLTDALDPLWQTLASGKFIDAVYIPVDGELSKRHMAMRRIARSLGIAVYGYRPGFVRVRRPATPPHI